MKNTEINTKKVCDAKQAEELARTTRETVVDEIITAFRSIPAVEGVRPVSGNCALVSFSTVAKHRGNLSPSYYINNRVGDYLCDSVQSKRSLGEIRDFTARLLVAGSVTISGETVRLNEEVLNTIRAVNNSLS